MIICDYDDAEGLERAGLFTVAVSAKHNECMSQWRIEGLYWKSSISHDLGT